ncbi:C4-dicarboxylate transporter DctA [compost metagenome]
MGIGRALTNLIGNCVATVAIARWENDIDIGRAQSLLDGRKAPVAPGGAQLRTAAESEAGR